MPLKTAYFPVSCEFRTPEDAEKFDAVMKPIRAKYADFVARHLLDQLDRINEEQICHSTKPVSIT
jgi:hypothetical protein